MTHTTEKGAPRVTQIVGSAAVLDTCPGPHYTPPAIALEDYADTRVTPPGSDQGS